LIPLRDLLSKEWLLFHVFNRQKLGYLENWKEQNITYILLQWWDITLKSWITSLLWMRVVTSLLGWRRAWWKKGTHKTVPGNKHVALWPPQLLSNCPTHPFKAYPNIGFIKETIHRHDALKMLLKLSPWYCCFYNSDSYYNIFLWEIVILVLLSLLTCYNSYWLWFSSNNLNACYICEGWEVSLFQSNWTQL
jgi:hypothetical protein